MTLNMSRAGTFSDDSVMLSEGNDADIDLCLMTKCDYHIIASSSFSWWGAWLGDSEKVVAPSNWFADSCAGKSVKDMSSVTGLGYDFYTKESIKRY